MATPEVNIYAKSIGDIYNKRQYIDVTTVKTCVCEDLLLKMRNVP